MSDVVKSEAGLALLLDRKINTGNIRPFVDVIAKTMGTHNLKTLDEASKWEREILGEMIYRRDFLKDTTLQQPPALPLPAQPAKQVARAERGFDFLHWIKGLLHL